MERSGDDWGPVIGVTMERGRVVIRPVGQLDEAGLDALQSLLESARATGHDAVLDLDEVTPAAVAVTPR